MKLYGGPRRKPEHLLTTFGKLWGVGHQYNRGPVTGLQLEQQIRNLLAIGGIQTAGRLICKDQPWLRHKSPGQRHPLLLTTRECFGKVLHAA